MKMISKNRTRQVGQFLFFSFLLLPMACQPNTTTFFNENNPVLHAWLDKQSLSPGHQLAEQIEEEQRLIFIQDNVLRADVLSLMKALLPTLHKRGAAVLGVFFLDTAEQEKLDAFLKIGFSDKETGPNRLEESEEENISSQAEALLFDADPAFGYTEYRDFLLYLRQYNETLSPSLSPLRLLALSHEGKLDDTLLNLSHSDLPILWLSSAYGVSFLHVAENNPPLNTQFIAVYGPGEKQFRWEGLLEKVAQERPLEDRSYLFKTSEAPFNTWPDEETLYPADFYLVTAFAYKSVTVIKDFISKEKVSQALSAFPQLKLTRPKKFISWRMNALILKKSRRLERRLKKIFARYEMENP